LWVTHDLTDLSCDLTSQEQEALEDVTHLFAENGPAGQRNGLRCGRLAEASGSHILRVASVDSPSQACRSPCDQFGQLRRVVHLVQGAPVMLLANLRTPAGLVNGALGTLVGVKLKDTEALSSTFEVPGAVSAQDIDYAVVDVPTYTGPVFFAAHPTWVPVEPIVVRHKRFQSWERLMLPMVLAWGITIHKSQGLTLVRGCVVDFVHQPTYSPVSTPGLAFVGMSRTPTFAVQGFKNLPGFWEFRKILQNQLFVWRALLEKELDKKHDSTMERHFGEARSTDADVEAHRMWSESRTGQTMSQESLADLRHMLGQRGTLEPPQYDDEPAQNKGRLQGGGGRSRIRAPTIRKTGHSVAAPGAHEALEPESIEDLGELNSVAAPGAHEAPEPESIEDLGELANLRAEDSTESPGSRQTVKMRSAEAAMSARKAWSDNINRALHKPKAVP